MGVDDELWRSYELTGFLEETALDALWDCCEAKGMTRTANARLQVVCMKAVEFEVKLEKSSAPKGFCLTVEMLLMLVTQRNYARGLLRS